MIFNKTTTKTEKVEIKTPSYYRWGNDYVNIISGELAIGVEIDRDDKTGRVCYRYWGKRDINRFIRTFLDSGEKASIFKISIEEYKKGLNNAAQYVNEIIT